MSHWTKPGIEETLYWTDKYWQFCTVLSELFFKKTALRNVLFLYEHTWWKLCVEGVIVSSQCLHHGGPYHHTLQPGFIEDWPGIQIPPFNLTHAHTGAWACVSHVNTDKRQKSANCSEKMDWCVTQLTKQQFMSERTERVDCLFCRMTSTVCYV